MRDRDDDFIVGLADALGAAALAVLFVAALWIACGTGLPGMEGL